MVLADCKIVYDCKLVYDGELINAALLYFRVVLGCYESFFFPDWTTHNMNSASLISRDVKWIEIAYDLSNKKMQSIADSFWALLKFRSKSRLSVFCLAECKLCMNKPTTNH